MMNKQTEQLRASALILDMGVTIPVRPFKYLYRKRSPLKWVMRTPALGGLMRIAHLYLSMGISYEQMKHYTYEQNMDLIATHGVTISRIVAHALIRGRVTGRWLNRPMAWFLRWRVHPLFLQEAMYQLLTMLNPQSFQTIINSVELINPMKPSLSHLHNGS